jgi:uncharacterized protein YndB with AHSA1/START domain
VATTTITPDQDAIDGELYVRAPPERVFAAISDPKQLVQWWGQSDMYRVTKCTGELRAGGKWRSEGMSLDGDPFHVEGEYIEVDPPRRLVYTWIASWAPELRTTVIWELTSQNNGSLIKIRHHGFAGHGEHAKNHAQGWIRVLAWMQAFVEKGETVDTRPPTA